MIAYQLPYYKEQRIKSGEGFEEDAADLFFPDHLYEMLHRTQDNTTNKKRFVRSSLNPDFHFEVREEPGINFWVECKFRELHQFNEQIHKFDSEQLKRFRSFQHSFLFICVKIQREQYYYFVPFSHIRTNELHFSFLNPYIVSVEYPVSPALVKKYLE